MAGAFFCGRWRDSSLYACGKPEQDDLKWLRVRCAIIRGNIIFYCNSGKSADFPELLFHRWGRSGQQHCPVSTPFREQFNGKRPQSFPIDKKKIHSSGYGAAHAEPFSIVLVFISLPASSGCGFPAGCAAGRCSPRSAPAHWGCGPAARSMRSHRRYAAPAS